MIIDLVRPHGFGGNDHDADDAVFDDDDGSGGGDHHHHHLQHHRRRRAKFLKQESQWLLERLARLPDKVVARKMDDMSKRLVQVKVSQTHRLSKD